MIWNAVAVVLICDYIGEPVRMHKIHHLSVLSALITPHNTPRSHSVSQNNWTSALLSDNAEQYSKLFSSPLGWFKAAIGCCGCVSLPFFPLSTEKPRCWQWAACMAAKWYFDEMTVSSLCNSAVCGTALWPGAPVGQADPWVYTAGICCCQLRQLPITDVPAASTLAAPSPLCWPHSWAQLASDEKWNVAADSEPVKGVYWVHGRLAC